MAGLPGGQEARATAAGAGLQPAPASRASRDSCRCPLSEAAELDQQLDLDAADVIHRGAPRAVTAVSSHRQAVELGLRVRHIPPDEAPEVGEALGVEQLAQLLDRRRAAQRVHQVAQDPVRQVAGPR